MLRKNASKTTSDLVPILKHILSAQRTVEASSLYRHCPPCFIESTSAALMQPPSSPLLSLLPSHRCPSPPRGPRPLATAATGSIFNTSLPLFSPARLCRKIHSYLMCRSGGSQFTPKGRHSAGLCGPRRQHAFLRVTGCSDLLYPDQWFSLSFRLLIHPHHFFHLFSVPPHYCSSHCSHVTCTHQRQEPVNSPPLF